MNRRILVGVAVGVVAPPSAAAAGTTPAPAGGAPGPAGARPAPAPPPRGGPRRPHREHCPALPAPDASGGPVPYYGYYGPFWHHGPFAFGFFGFLFPLLGLVLIFGLLRALFWGPWCAGLHRLTKAGVPPMFAEWHSRAHESTQ